MLSATYGLPTLVVSNDFNDLRKGYYLINTRTIQKVIPPHQIRQICPATGETIEVNVPDRRYRVIFKAGRKQEDGFATSADLVAAGIPLPPGWS